MSGWDVIKDGARVVRDAGNIELYEKLWSAWGAAVEQQVTIHEKDARIAELEQRLAFKGKLKLRDNCLWNEADDDDNVPYCSRCFEVDEKAVHLHDHDWTWRCPACDGGALKPGRHRPPPVVVV